MKRISLNRVRVLPLYLLILGILVEGYAKPKFSKVMVVRPEGKGFSEASEGILSEVPSNLLVDQYIYDVIVDKQKFTKRLSGFRPDFLILMDNPSVYAYKEFLQETKDKLELPSLSMLGIDIGQSMEGLKNAVGINYEVPLVTSIVDFRNIVKDSIHRVGVIHRNVMADFIRKNQDFCRDEKIDLIAMQLAKSEEENLESITNNLKLLNGKVDAFWVLNDNVLLTREIIIKVWIPLASQFKKPIIVGAEPLASPGINFGSFAVVPDHYSLGVQAINRVLDYFEYGTLEGELKIEEPLSTHKVLNKRQDETFFRLKDTIHQTIDKVLK